MPYRLYCTRCGRRRPIREFGGGTICPRCREAVAEGLETYRIVRYYEKARTQSKRRVLKRGVTLAEAQAHCQNPETSSETAKGWDAVYRTMRHGPWFDGFEAE